MRKIATVLGLGLIGAALVGAAKSSSQAPAPAKPTAGAPAGSTEKALEEYLLKYLPFDPESRVSVARTTEKTVSGFRAYKVKRTGRYEKLKLDKVVFLSDDGKWFFAGDTLPNVDPKPVRTNEDLSWLSTYLTNLFHTGAHAALAPNGIAAV